jgi:outer membrane protein TolC
MMKQWLIIVFGFATLPLIAQEGHLTLEQALGIALENNFDLRVTQRNAKIAENQAIPSNAGLTPWIGVNGSGNWSLTNSSIRINGESESREIDNAQFRGYNGQLALQYTVFSGLANLNIYRNLQAADKMGELELRLRTELTITQIYSAYYEVARLQNELIIARGLKDISKERYLRAQSNFQFGSNTSLDVLNAEVNLNNDSVSVLRAELNLENAHRNLNAAMGVEIEQFYDVDTALTYMQDLSLDALLEEAMQNNTSITMAMYRQMMRENDLKVSQSERYPRLDMTAGYGYNWNKNDASILDRSSSLGLSGGITLRWTIFDANRINANVENARLAIESSEIEYNKARSFAERDVRNAWAFYQNNLAILAVEQTNLQTNIKNFERTEELFSRGQITTTQFREAQINLARAYLNFNSARYNSKVAEIELIRLAGILIE